MCTQSQFFVHTWGKIWTFFLRNRPQNPERLGRNTGGIFSHKTKEFDDAARNPPGQLRASKNLPVRAGSGKNKFVRAGPGRAKKILSGPGRVGQKKICPGRAKTILSGPGRALKKLAGPGRA